MHIKGWTSTYGRKWSELDLERQEAPKEHKSLQSLLKLTGRCHRCISHASLLHLFYNCYKLKLKLFLLLWSQHGCFHILDVKPELLPQSESCLFTGLVAKDPHQSSSVTGSGGFCRTFKVATLRQFGFHVQLNLRNTNNTDITGVTRKHLMAD